MRLILWIIIILLLWDSFNINEIKHYIWIVTFIILILAYESAIFWERKMQIINHELNEKLNENNIDY